jgi:predicted deacylase
MARISVGVYFFLVAGWLCGCGRAAAPAEERFPWVFVREALDAAPEEAEGALLRRWPESQRQEGSFARYQVAGSEVLDEVTFFRDLHSGRVNAVIVKYKAGLPRGDQAAALEALEAPSLAVVLGSEAVAEAPRGPLLLRARGADREGRLTITVEAAP